MAKKSGTYTISLDVAGTGKAGVSANNGKVIEAPLTGSDWHKLNMGKVSLKKGKNTIVVSAVEGGFKFRSMKIK
jgi:hypothetical protein